MYRPCDQFLSRAAFSRNQDWSTRVLETGNHPQDILNLRRGPDNSVKVGFRIHAFTEKPIFFYQAYFFRHASQEKTKLFQRRERFPDIVVRTKFHGPHSSLD